MLFVFEDLLEFFAVNWTIDRWFDMFVCLLVRIHKFDDQFSPSELEIFNFQSFFGWLDPSEG
jgi:hypothetical protein